jgi:hypothetical protein
MPTNLQAGSFSPNALDPGMLDDPLADVAIRSESRP